MATRCEGPTRRILNTAEATAAARTASPMPFGKLFAHSSVTIVGVAFLHAPNETA